MMISGQRKPVQNELAKKSAIRSRSLRCLRGWDEAECEVHGGVSMDPGSVEDRKRCVALIKTHSHLRATENMTERTLSHVSQAQLAQHRPLGLRNPPRASLHM